MNYKIKEKDFKKLGFRFAKLYARNYKVYIKDIQEHLITVYCFVAKKEIEICDFYSHSESVYNYIKNIVQSDVWDIYDENLQHIFGTLENQKHIYFKMDRRTGKIFSNDTVDIELNKIYNNEVHRDSSRCHNKHCRDFIITKPQAIELVKTIDTILSKKTLIIV
jgi:hypothetical protein